MSVFDVGGVRDVKIAYFLHMKKQYSVLLFPYRRALALSTLERGKVLLKYSSQSPSGLNSVQLNKALVLSVLVYEHFLL